MRMKVFRISYFQLDVFYHFFFQHKNTVNLITLYTVFGIWVAMLAKSKRFKGKFAKQCFPSNCLVRLEFLNPTMAI